MNKSNQNYTNLSISRCIHIFRNRPTLRLVWFPAFWSPTNVKNLHSRIFTYIYLKRCHWETWLRPRVLKVPLPPTHKVQPRPDRAWKARQFSTVWFWTIWSVTRGPWRIWIRPLWGECRRPRKAMSRRWSNEEWRAVPSNPFWPAWEVNTHTNITTESRKSPKMRIFKMYIYIYI